MVVEITDRGPYIRGRGIDLSYAAARELGIVNRGVTRVQLELMKPENEVASSATTGVETALATTVGEWAPVSIVE